MKHAILSAILLLGLLCPAQANSELDDFLDSISDKRQSPPAPRYTPPAPAPQYTPPAPAPRYTPPPPPAPRYTAPAQADWRLSEIIRKRVRMSEHYDSDYELQQDIATYCAPVISIMHSNVRLSRAELFKNLKAFDRGWPWRSYQILAVAKNGNCIEIQVSYERSNNKKSSSGYAIFAIILDDAGRICAMGEKSKRSAPPAFSPGMQHINF